MFILVGIKFKTLLRPKFGAKLQRLGTHPHQIFTKEFGSVHHDLVSPESYMLNLDFELTF